MEDEKRLIEELRGHFAKAEETLKLLTIRNVDILIEVGTNIKTVSFPRTEFLDITVKGSIQKTEEL